MTRIRSILPLLMVALVVSACASTGGLKVKQDATRTLSGIETTLTETRMAEQALFDAQLGYTVDQHRAFLAKLDQAQVGVIAAAKALQIWVPGQPVPADIPLLLQTANQLLALLHGGPPLPTAAVATSAVATTETFRSQVQALYAALNQGVEE